eukprot:6212713-Pleurochrysis_carterae.AAC.4
MWVYEHASLWVGEAGHRRAGVDRRACGAALSCVGKSRSSSSWFWTHLRKHTGHASVGDSDAETGQLGRERRLVLVAAST